MHRSIALAILILAAAAVSPAARSASDDAHAHEAHEAPRPVVLMPGMGHLHHQVSTRSVQAQRFFDQGLTFVYAFNHDEAVRSFGRAAELDPHLAMAYWGIGLALGPNINLDVDPEREKAAYGATRTALKLASGTSERERAYIMALAKRYSNDPKADLKKLAVEYKDAMGDLMRRYPDDLDAATLYAESAMDLRPWQLWSADGKPAEGTEEIVSVLESVLKRDPNHIGANHYYIHAMEASPHPERALPSARRLQTLVPAAGHLVHMPAHIFMRTGDYAGVVRSNQRAAAADRAYIEKTGATGVYPMMYYSHNLHFLAVGSAMQGRYEVASRAAEQLVANIQPFAKEMPMVEGYLPTPTLIRIRCRRWDEILKQPRPASDSPLIQAADHFARGMASASTGKRPEAEAELKAMLANAARVPADYMIGFSTARTIFELAGDTLDARIARAGGDRKTTIDRLRKAVEIEDSLPYDEPPDWYLPSRESLGGALLLDGQPVEAEKVFRADLERHPNSGRSLFGLKESLKAQGRTADAERVAKEFEEAWKDADTPLQVEDL